MPFSGRLGTSFSELGNIQLGAIGAPPTGIDADLLAALYTVKTATAIGGPVTRSANTDAAGYAVKTARIGRQLTANRIAGGWLPKHPTMTFGAPILLVGTASAQWKAFAPGITKTQLFPAAIAAGYSAPVAHLPSFIMAADKVPPVGDTFRLNAPTITTTQLFPNAVGAQWKTSLPSGASVNPTRALANTIAAQWKIPPLTGADITGYILQAHVVSGQWQTHFATNNPTQIFALKVAAPWGAQTATIHNNRIDAHKLAAEWDLRGASLGHLHTTLEAEDPGFWGNPSASLLAGNTTLAVNRLAANWQVKTAKGPGECWEPLTQRILGYFAPLFSRDSRGLFGRILAAVARELSGCTEEVQLVESPDVRGDGAFNLTTRFEPIVSVASVKRYDSGGNLLQSYTVDSFSGQTIVLKRSLKYGSFKYGAQAYGGGKAPGRGDLLRATYVYLHKGLEYRVREALQQLNILTSAAEFLDGWGRWFGVPRLTTGTYGSFVYGGAKYGTAGREGDTQYSRRIIATIQRPRNTKPAILGAVQALTGGAPYMVEWFEADADRGFVFRPAGADPWVGEANDQATKFHLIWGQTARFLNRNVSGGGPCVAEIWVPQDTPFSSSKIVEVCRGIRAAGVKLIVRTFANPKRAIGPLSDSGAGTDAFVRTINP